MNTCDQPEELKTAWRAAKAAEDAANAERLRVEAAIVALMPSKLEGSVTDAACDRHLQSHPAGRRCAAKRLAHHAPESVQQAAWKPSVDASPGALEGYDLTTAQNLFHHHTSGEAWPFDQRLNLKGTRTMSFLLASPAKNSPAARIIIHGDCAGRTQTTFVVRRLRRS